jgi:protoporphyrinogen oxidase
MAGLGAAYRLRAEGIVPDVFDKNDYYGGHTASFRYETGFLFDMGPHISFTKDERIQELFADSVDGNYDALQIQLTNYWQGHWPIHPVQLHLHGLPDDLVVKIISDFVEEEHGPDRPIRNYADWLLASFGRTFAETFPMQYTRKYHLTSAENMSTDWLGPRIYRPSLEEVVRGAISTAAPHKHYITHFRYPSAGGFSNYLTKFLPNCRLELGSEAVAIDPANREVRFSGGQVEKYDGLVSSVPLKDLVPMIAGVPQDVLEASRRLACSTCVLVNLGVDRADLSEAHMTYFYDEDICFTRLSFPHMLSENNAPPGKGSIQAEVYFSSKYRPLEGEPDDWIDPVIRDLKRCGILKEDDPILHRSSMLVPYANVIFDLDRAEAVETVHGFLDDVDVHYCGRYGDWGYMWTDESFKSGEDAATRMLDRSELGS